MNLRQILSATILYGMADVIVLVVSGFLLLPLYTRTLSQAEFGIYIAVRANTDILGYILYLGLPSAISRLYFDHNRTGEHLGYLRSVVAFFCVNVLVVGGLLALFGGAIWRILSPAVPPNPYLWFAFAISAVGFLATVGSLTYRLAERAVAFLALQLASAAVLAVVAILTLRFWHLGVSGVFASILVSYVLPSFALFYLLLRGAGQRLNREHVVKSLRYGAPFVISYISYFVLNRFNTVVLQRYVELDQLAVFGFAQQISVLIAVMASSFGKALQPAVFNATPEQAPAMLYRSGRAFIGLMFVATSALILFAPEMIRILAPRSYGASLNYLLILVVGNFVYALTLVSNTTLEYYKKPNVAALSATIAAGFSAALCLVLVPRYHLYGAAVSVAVAFLAAVLLSYAMAYRLTRQSHFGPILVTFLATTGLAVVSAVLATAGLAPWAMFLVQLGLWFAASATMLLVFVPLQTLSSWLALLPRLR